MGDEPAAAEHRHLPNQHIVLTRKRMRLPTPPTWQVSGAPVVSDAGELIANLSISDLRALTSEHFGVMALPVAEFLAVEHQTAYIGWVRLRGWFQPLAALCDACSICLREGAPNQCCTTGRAEPWARAQAGAARALSRS